MLKDELSKIKVAVGSRFCSSFYITTNSLHLNSKGKAEDCESKTLFTVIEDIKHGVFKWDAEKDCFKYNKRHNTTELMQPKMFAKSIYPSNDHRYTLNEKNEEGKFINNVNGAYYHWNGFLGFDCDFPHDKYKQAQRKELGIKLKKIIFNKLKRYHWFVMSTLSTGGNGTHIYTYIELPYNYDKVEDIILYYQLNYYCKAICIIDCIYELSKEVDYFDESDIANVIDTCTLQPAQTINITVTDINPFVNNNFIYQQDQQVNEIFNNGDYKIDVDTLKLLNVYDEKVIDAFQQIYNPKKHAVNKNNVNNVINNNITYTIESNLVDLSKCKQPYHWQHKRKQGNDFFTGNQVINTLRLFFDNETIGKIFMDSRFYDCDGSDWARFANDSRWDSIQSKPNYKLINFLNENCGFNLKIKEEVEIDEYDFNGYKIDHIINLKENEYLSDYKDEVLNKCVAGFNLWIADTGLGKTTFITDMYKDIDPLNVNDDPTIVITEPYNSVLKAKYKNFNVITGSKQINLKTNLHMLIPTNYNHIIKIDDEDLKLIDYIVIDESHLLLIEAFRNKVIIPLIEKLHMAANYGVKIILMTGTPLDEDKIFNIDNTILFKKPTDKKINYRYLRFIPNDELQIFDICVLSDLIKCLVNIEHRKVLVYQDSMSITKCNKLKAMLNDINVGIYHKRYADDNIHSEAIDYIDTYHKLGDKYDVLISSCYFGVGHDLNDDCNTACIMLGNHIWHHDKQVIGRWRNSKDIKAFTIILDDFDKFNKYENNYEQEYNKAVEELTRKYNNRKSRKYSVVIRKSTIDISNIDEIPFLARMQVVDDYNKNYDHKLKMLSAYNIDIDERIMPLRYCETQYEDIIIIKKILKDERNEKKSIIINNIINHDKYNEDIIYDHTDAKIEKWQRTLIHLLKFDKDLFYKLLYKNYITKFTYVDSINLYMELFKSYRDNSIDWPEVYAFEYFRINRRKINKEDYYSIYKLFCFCYIIFYFYKNKGSDSYNLKYDYFRKFKENCIYYCKMHPLMIDKLYTVNEDMLKIGPILEGEFAYKEYAKLDNIEGMHFKDEVKNQRYAMYKKLLSYYNGSIEVKKYEF